MIWPQQPGSCITLVPITDSPVSISLAMSYHRAKHICHGPNLADRADCLMLALSALRM
jgi:hypothetical protein